MAKVIAIEGIDGSGKGVQFKKLTASLEAMGYRVDARDYPIYESFFGAEVGRLLSGTGGVRADEVDQKSMALWFALDRFESFRNYCGSNADYLVLNRFVLSNAVYQSVRDRDADKPDIVDWVMELEYGRFGLPRPDVNLVFSVKPESAERNVAKKGYRCYVGEGRDIYEASKGIQQRAMDKYLELAGRFSDIAVIPCMDGEGLRSVDAIASSVLDELRARRLL